jgi:hypothetical protein
MDNRAFINGNMYDVTTPENYRKNPDLYNNKSAVELNGCVYPIRNGNYNPDMIGYYPGVVYDRYSIPTNEEEFNAYSTDHMANFNSVTKLQELVTEQNKINTDQMLYLSTPDNIFRPVIDNIKDEPLMIGLKEAIIAKEIDINKYQSKFKQFSNDRRKFNGHKISLDKAVSTAQSLDMKITAVIEDTNPNVPNPIGRKIIIDLTPGSEDE